MKLCSIKLPTCFQQPGIYLILNRQVKQFYIGSSVNCYNRIHGHFHTLIAGKHHNNHFQAAFRKYGLKVFTATVLEFCTREEIVDREQHYIDLYKPVYNKNLKVDQPYFRTYTDEQRAWQSADKKKKIAAGLIAVSCAKVTVQWLLDGKKKIAEFRSMRTASEAVGSVIGVSKCIYKKTYIHAGFQWRLKDDLPVNMTSKVKIKGQERSKKCYVLFRHSKKKKTFKSILIASIELKIKYKKLSYQLQKKKFYKDKNIYLTN